MNSHDPSGWLADFAARWAGGARYPFEKFCKTQQLYSPIVAVLKPEDVLLEFGAGSCVNSLLIALLCPGTKVIATDLVEGHLDLAREYMEKNFFIPSNLSFQQIDIVKDKIPEGVTAILSDGVLEHFNSAQLLAAFEKMESIRKVFISVPVNGAAVEYGDERIMPSRWWEEEIKNNLQYHKKITTHFTDHNKSIFKIARKFLPYEQLVDGKSRFKGIYSAFNSIFHSIEKRFASSVLYHAEQ